LFARAQNVVGAGVVVVVAVVDAMAAVVDVGVAVIGGVVGVGGGGGGAAVVVVVVGTVSDCVLECDEETLSEVLGDDVCVVD